MTTTETPSDERSTAVPDGGSAQPDAGSGAAIKAKLGRYGIWTDVFDAVPAGEIERIAASVEVAGFGGLWIPEVTAGREASTLATLLLASTGDLVVGNGIQKMSGRPAVAAASASRLLADQFPDRHVLGLGVGPLKPVDGTPLRFAEDYLATMDTAPFRHPVERVPFRLLAAYGPGMLGLAARLTAGAMTYAVPLSHTAFARSAIGPASYLCVEQAVVYEADPTAARAIAREHLDIYFRTPFNRAKFVRLGYTEQDMADGGSDALVDDLVAWGTADAVTERLEGQFAAGADHVVVNVLGESGDRLTRRWTEMGRQLTTH